MRPERLYLIDIIEAADSIQGFLKVIEEAEFLKSETPRSAVSEKLTVIGEAACHLPQDYSDSYPEIPSRAPALPFYLIRWPLTETVGSNAVRVGRLPRTSYNG